MTPEDKRLKYEAAGIIKAPRDTRRSIRIFTIWCNESVTLINLPEFELK